MKKYFEILRKCPLFLHIRDEDLLTMLPCLGARVEHFEKKYTVIAEGNPVRHIGILLSGAAQIIRMDYYGNRSIVGTAGPSEIICETFACAEVSAIPVSVVTCEPCEIMLIEARKIMHACEHACGFHRQLIFNLMKDLASKNMQFHQKLEITSRRTTREKLLAYLSQEKKKAGSNSFTIPFDRQALADYLEVDRSGLSAEISKLRKEGILESRKNEFTLF